jgi:hypothetical protein
MLTTHVCNAGTVYKTEHMLRFIISNGETACVLRMANTACSPYEDATTSLLRRYSSISTDSLIKAGLPPQHALRVYTVKTDRQCGVSMLRWEAIDVCLAQVCVMMR